MPVEILLEVRSFGFTPATEDGWLTHRSLAVGSLIRGRLVRSKSDRALKFYWALVQKVGDGCGIGKRPLSNELLVRTGYVETLKFKNGEVHAIPRSIADMKHDEFCDYMESAIQLICQDYIALTRGQLLRDVEKMLNIKYDDAVKGNKNAE